MAFASDGNSEEKNNGQFKPQKGPMQSLNRFQTPSSLSEEACRVNRRTIKTDLR